MKSTWCEDSGLYTLCFNLFFRGLIVDHRALWALNLLRELLDWEKGYYKVWANETISLLCPMMFLPVNLCSRSVKVISMVLWGQLEECHLPMLTTLTAELRRKMRNSLSVFWVKKHSSLQTAYRSTTDLLTGRDSTSVMGAYNEGLVRGGVASERNRGNGG